MTSISSTDARKHISTLLDQVARGKTILITRRGRPAALLAPPPMNDHKDVQQAIEEIRALRRGNKLGKGISIRDLIEDEALLGDLAEAAEALALDDDAGNRWCRKNGYPGYTSYASLDDLPWRFPAFRQLAKSIDRHVAGFAKDLEFDLGRRRRELSRRAGDHEEHLGRRVAADRQTERTARDGRPARARAAGRRPD